VIFFIYLYQRYIYPIDPKRVNEYGTSQEMMDSNGRIIPPTDEDKEPAAITEGEVAEDKSSVEKKND
jgi:hypothetical protein